AKLEQARLEAEVARLEQEKADREEAIRQERLAANEKIWADRQQAQDDLYRLQAQRDALLYQQRWRTRRIVTVVDSCTPVYRPTTIYRPTTACPPSRPTTTVMVRVLAPRQTTTPQPAPQRSSGISPSNPNLNWHPAWNKTGAPPMNRR
ncbi:MAG: hypothetical protein ACAI25_01435, partial [Planctomycetota bacterium]